MADRKVVALIAVKPEIALVCPTRDRVQPAIEFARSVRETSTYATVLFYIDDDQREMYRPLVEAEPECVFHYGPRIGPVAADNLLVDAYRDFKVYGTGDDDARFVTPSWDAYLLEQIAAFPNRIGVVSANHWVDPTFLNFGYVSREWIDAVGWLAYPPARHRIWDSVLQMLGEATNLVYAPRDKFRVEHRMDKPQDLMTFAHDCEAFLWFCVQYKNPIIDKLRQAMGANR